MRSKMMIFLIALLVAVLIFILIPTYPKQKQEKQKIKINLIMPNKVVESMMTEARVVNKKRSEIIKVEAEMPKYNLKLPLELQKFIWFLCLEKGLTYETFLAIMREESRLDQYAEGKNYNKTKTKIMSRDLGYMGLNDRFKEEHAAFAGVSKDKFDYFNPYHNIRSSMNRLCYIRKYWIRNGVNGDENLWFYMLNSYNMGIEGYKRYLDYNDDLSREYDQKILKWKEMLEVEEMLE